MSQTLYIQDHVITEMSKHSEAMPSVGLKSCCTLTCLRESRENAEGNEGPRREAETERIRILSMRALSTQPCCLELQLLIDSSGEETMYGI